MGLNWIELARIGLRAEQSRPAEWLIVALALQAWLLAKTLERKRGKLRVGGSLVMLRASASEKSSPKIASREQTQATSKLEDVKPVRKKVKT